MSSAFFTAGLFMVRVRTPSHYVLPRAGWAPIVFVITMGLLPMRERSGPVGGESLPPCMRFWTVLSETNPYCPRRWQLDV